MSPWLVFDKNLPSPALFLLSDGNVSQVAPVAAASLSYTHSLCLETALSCFLQELHILVEKTFLKKTLMLVHSYHIIIWTLVPNVNLIFHKDIHQAV